MFVFSVTKVWLLVKLAIRQLPTCGYYGLLVPSKLVVIITVRSPSHTVQRPQVITNEQICFHKWLYFDSFRQSAASAEPMRPLRCINKVSWHAKLLLLFIFSVVPLWPLVSSIPCISHPPSYPVSLHDRDLHCNCESYLMCQRKILLDTIPRTIIDS